MSKLPESNPAQVRGDIQHGRTGDKKRGFDPSAAPLETDDEAAGMPLTPDAAGTARIGQRPDGLADTSTEYGDAMRPLPAADRRQSPNYRLVLLMAGILVIAGVLALAIGTG
ncbi:hypothetical protein [Sinorhizobium mexicanum]|uniref:Uncharacterized protein n=1 Tax=Sinorhizobium mexicanum TaxID=375549 RepID=A0A859R1Y7_9HYPH|nr:hypothetical protein [Sinorhizobium mexicanum]MBP1884302.1 hypothetical protein [Sinorhizobium mexicanum]QLL64991.1 hypothetical protein FKV68_26840 [Sinorhizobium mexicanum]